MTNVRRFFALSAVASISVAGLAFAPVAANASNRSDYLVTNVDGTTSVESLTASQAASVANNDNVAIVEPDRKVAVTDASVEQVFGLGVSSTAVAGDPIPGRYIVTFNSATAAQVSVASSNVNVLATYTNAINGYTADLTADQLSSLRANPNVTNIEQDRVVSVNGTSDQSGATWGLDRIDQRALPLDGHYKYNYDGTGVTAYVVDTGIYAAHVQFGSRVSASGFTAITDGNGTNDCHGHGTHVSGTIGGSTYGVAKNVTLVPVRVLDCNGSGSTSGVIAGLNWVVGAHQAGVPAVANLSLGGALSTTLNAAVAAAVADGVTVAVAAGNSAADACLSSPSSEPSALTVGASDSADQQASFSNFGKCVDIYAPGVGITSSYIGSPTTYASMSGTSMASPHVAGVAALYLQANPTATPAQVATALTNASTKNVVLKLGAGSPNQLLYSASFANAPAGVPSAVGSVSAASTSGTSVTVTWTTPASNGGAAITDYTVEYAPVSNSSTTLTWTPFAHTATTGTSLVVTGLTTGTPYYFRVSAKNSVGNGPTTQTSSTVTPQIAGLPSAPNGFTAATGRLQITLAWTAPTTTGTSAISDYVIQQSTDGLNFAPITRAASTTTSYTVTGLTAGTPYWFKVAAKNTAGVGAYTAVVSATPLAYTAPGVVTSLTAAAALSAATVTWVAPVDTGGGAITGYAIDYSSDNGATYTGRVTASSTARSYTISGITGGTRYLIRVRAQNQYGTSADATVAVTPTAPLVPSPPVLKTAVSNNYNSETLTWTAPVTNGGSTITNYAVEYSTDGTNWTRSPMIAASATTYGFSTLQGGVAYQFRVIAFNGVGASQPSNEMTATPMAYTVTSEPRALSGVVSGTSAYLSWSVPLSYGGLTVTGYKVYSSTNGVNWTLIGSTDGATRSFSATGLTQGVTYSFKVTALNTVGESAASNIATLTYKIAGTPNPPTSVTASANATAINVVWSGATAGSAPITDYVIEYMTGNTTTWTVYADGVSTATNAVLTGFPVDVPVTLRVKAVNSYGPSPASVSVTVTPRSAVTAPSSPTGVITAAGDTKIGVKWTIPTNNGGGNISGYAVTANPGGNKCATTTTSCVVTGLTNGVLYTFTVTATNAAGTSAPSAASLAMSPVEAPMASAIAQSWGLDRIDQHNLPLDGYISRDGSGLGVTAYVIDTGIFTGSNQFPNLRSGWTAISDGRGTNDCNGHGTHVAGTIGGATYGVAPRATLVPVRVLDCTGSGNLSDVVAGIDWMIADHVAGTPAVANLSLGTDYSASLNDAVARAVADGITVVVAAGNENSDSCTKSPASASGALTVAASTNADAKASYSNWGACVDLFAPGSSIVSAGISGYTSTATMSGTSMASPHAAGVAAALLTNNKWMSPSDVATTMKADATVGALSGVDNSTVNALLFEHQVTAGTVMGFDDGDPALLELFDNSADSASSNFDFGNAAPVAVVKRAVAIKRVSRTAKGVTVTVTAPKGATITLYRNNKVVAKGKNTTFVLAGKVTAAQKFKAVASLNGSLITSSVVMLSVRAPYAP